MIAGPAAAATSIWVAGADNSNWSDPLNWDGYPTAMCKMYFPANIDYEITGMPVNDLLGSPLVIDELNVYEANIAISGNAITCQNINVHSAGTVTISLPISTNGTAALTVIALSGTGILKLSGLLTETGPVTYSGPGTKRLTGSINNTLFGYILRRAGHPGTGQFRLGVDRRSAARPQRGDSEADHSTRDQGQRGGDRRRHL